MIESQNTTIDYDMRLICHFTYVIYFLSFNFLLFFFKFSDSSSMKFEISANWIDGGLLLIFVISIIFLTFFYDELRRNNVIASGAELLQQSISLVDNSISTVKRE